MGNLSHVESSTWNVEHWKESVTRESNSPFGPTRYTLLGPENGPRLVFIHGITASACAFPEFIQGLADSGFRVLVYDLFGRGFSAAPAAQYNDSLYVTQLYFLCADLGWNSFHLVGSSLGGGNSLDVISRNSYGFCSAISRKNKVAVVDCTSRTFKRTSINCSFFATPTDWACDLVCNRKKSSRKNF